MVNKTPISALLLAILLVGANALTCTDSSTWAGDANCYACADTSTCSSCAAGYSRTSATVCTICAAGTQAAAGNTATTCTSCAAGKWSAAGATTCTDCLAGTYLTSASGGTAAASCTSCAAGKWSAAAAASCTDCTAGTYLTSASGGTAAASCTNCLANTYSAAAAASCTNCNSGYFSAAAATSCTACSTGCATCSSAASTACNTCSGGYAWSSTATTCTQCTANTASPGGSTLAVCTACGSGLVSNAGASSCSTPYTTTTTASAFSAAPGKVFDGSTGATDVLTWGTYDKAWYGPGAANTTVYAYAWQTGSGTLAKVVSRTLNATILSNGTADTSMASKVGDDAVYTTAITGSGFKAAVGLGSTGIAYSADDSSGCNQVYISIFNGGTASPIVTKAVTSNTCSHCTTNTVSTGVGYVNSVGSVTYDNGTYFVAYSSKKYTETETLSGGHSCTSGTTFATGINTFTNVQVFAYVQGVTTNNTLTWTASVALYSGTATAVNVAASPSSVTPQCAPQNYTNSSNLICAYTSNVSPQTISSITVAVSTGTAGSATTIATNVVATTTYPNTDANYYVAGFVYGQYVQGVLLGLQANTYSALSTYTSANTLQFVNLTSGASVTAGGVAVTGISNTYSSGYYGATGLIYSTSTGYAILDAYVSSATGTVYEYSTWQANGTANVTKTTWASGNGGSLTSSHFVDAKGALWAGVYSYASSLQTGYLGKIATLYSFGNILASFFALLSFVIAALLAF